MKFRINSNVLMNVLLACDSAVLQRDTRPILQSTMISVVASDDGKSAIAKFIGCDSMVAFVETVEWSKDPNFDKDDFVAESGKCSFDGKRVMALLKAHQFITKIPHQVTIMDTEEKISFWVNDEFFAVPKFPGEYPLDPEKPFAMATSKEVCVPVSFSSVILMQLVKASVRSGSDCVIKIYVPKENNLEHPKAIQADFSVANGGGKEAGVILTQMRISEGRK